VCVNVCARAQVYDIYINIRVYAFEYMCVCVCVCVSENVRVRTRRRNAGRYAMTSSYNNMYTYTAECVCLKAFR